ncbi:MAG: nuclear transport factor 2 family protein [Spirirestis rafaelensis WJT71-NPBG6]|jgi:ketosteroid isomerase-like protein|nr:nuclear transport factor 2 family protein [Spirirestis rafaelensis WJT71-NPBG6]
MQSTLTSEECQAFKNLVQDYYAVWSPGRNSFDISKAESFYSQGSELTAYDVFHTDGAIKGWDNYRAELTRIMDNFADFNIIMNKDDVEVFCHGDIAWTTSDFKIKGAFKNGQPIESVGRNSLVWQRQDNGRWLIVHEHSSAPIMS